MDCLLVTEIYLHYANGLHKATFMDVWMFLQKCVDLFLFWGILHPPPTKV